MEQRENTFAIQCMLTKQYGKYKAAVSYTHLTLDSFTAEDFGGGVRGYWDTATGVMNWREK